MNRTPYDETKLGVAALAVIMYASEDSVQDLIRQQSFVCARQSFVRNTRLEHDRVSMDQSIYILELISQTRQVLSHDEPSGTINAALRMLYDFSEHFVRVAEALRCMTNPVDPSEPLSLISMEQLDMIRGVHHDACDPRNIRPEPTDAADLYDSVESVRLYIENITKQA